MQGKFLGFIIHMSALEIFATLISVVGVALTIRRSLYCWPVNLLAYIIYGYLFFQYQLYGETILQGCFVLLGCYGWWYWIKDRQQADAENDARAEITVQQIQGVRLVLHVVFTLIVGALSGWALATFTEAAVPYLDAELACLSLLATYWTSQRYLQTWALWIAVDIVYVLMFGYKELYLTAILYAGFVGLAIFGLNSWRKQQRAVIL